MKKDPVEAMRIVGAVRGAIHAYQREHEVAPGAAFALFGDTPMEVFFLLSNPARTAEDNRALAEKVGALKAKGLDLSGIQSAPQVGLA